MSRKDRDGMIELYRVVFDQPVDIPGAGRGVYSTTDKVVESVACAQRKNRRGYHLWLDVKTGFVLIEHPDSGSVERANRMKLVSCKFMDDAEKEPEGKKAGPVNSLEPFLPQAKKQAVAEGQ